MGGLCKSEKLDRELVACKRRLGICSLSEHEYPTLGRFIVPNTLKIDWQ